MGYKVEVMPQKTADNYYEMLYRFSKVLKKLKLKYWLEGGTLIGAIREGAILSWDKDVDVSMLETDRKKLWKNKDLIKKWGLKPGYTDQIYRIDFKNVYMDIFSFEYKNGIYQEIHKFNRTRWPQSYYKSKHLFPLKKAKLGPLIQYVPNMSKDFLRQAYGDWEKIPKMFLPLKKYKIDGSEKLKNWILKNENKEEFKTVEKKPTCYNYILYLILIAFIIYNYKKK